MTTGSKHDPMTVGELEAFQLRPQLLSGLRDCARRFGVPAGDLRVLDWGCRRGLTVLKLLELGFDACGVDLDERPLRNGAQLMRARGADPDARLACLAPDGRTPFPAGHFHVVISDQVFEHVRDPDVMLAEMARITRPGGARLHFFPARWCLIEPHLRLPCLHWLPKNALRRWYIRILLRRIPEWRELAGRSASEKVHTYCEYSLYKTYYRPLRTLLAALGRHGFEPALITVGGGRWLRRLLSVLKSRPEWQQRVRVVWTNTFGTAAIACTRTTTASGDARAEVA